MEAMSKIKAVIMDKTGTITKGDFTVQKIVGGDELLELCADCEQQSTHPIAESIVAAAKARNMELRRPEELEELAGRGIRAKLDGKEILCGNERLLTEKGVSFPSPGNTAPRCWWRWTAFIRATCSSPTPSRPARRTPSAPCGTAASRR